jgi:hypothetical protein
MGDSPESSQLTLTDDGEVDQFGGGHSTSSDSAVYKYSPTGVAIRQAPSGPTDGPARTASFQWMAKSMTRLALILTLAAAHIAQCQAVRPFPAIAYSSAPQIMSRLHRLQHFDLGAPLLLDVLRQNGRAQPRAKLDELADSLAEIAIEAGGPKADRRRGNEVVSALSALFDVGNEGFPGGTPYDGALDRLIRIHREGHDRSVRDIALRYSMAVVGHPRALAYLRGVATSSDETASNAMAVLLTDAQGHGLGKPPTAAQQQETNAVLRDLFDRRVVKDFAASRDLDKWARSQGWYRP